VPPPVVFFGSSGYALTIRDATPALWEPDPLATVVAYIDDFRGDRDEAIDGSPIISFETWRRSLGNVPVLVTVGSPQARRMLAKRVSVAGGRFASLFRIANPIARNVIAGEGTAIMAYVSIGASTVIGRHVQILPLATIDGGCMIGDYAMICPTAAICGRVIVEEGVFIGVGARIVNESDHPLTIGAEATIGAGSVVTCSVRPGQKLAGNPAQELRSLAATRRVLG
jgi:sugar O-acyltransferase (sialic acid O-acetyltransferase NeuD family)